LKIQDKTTCLIKNSNRAKKIVSTCLVQMMVQKFFLLTFARLNQNNLFRKIQENSRKRKKSIKKKTALKHFLSMKQGEEFEHRIVSFI